MPSLKEIHHSKQLTRRHERINHYIEEVKAKRQHLKPITIIDDEPFTAPFTITQEIIQKSNEIPILRCYPEERIRVDQTVIDKCVPFRKYGNHTFSDAWIDPTSLQLYQRGIQLERIQQREGHNYTCFRLYLNTYSNIDSTLISLKQLQLGNFN
ncbi:Hypothetical_protein [Hexamita inflata]|uniref:Hypothetical_protein n=1 Tax=Hexamita inflata TaxID=28002 RepID=A0AA86V425_9EUKA|nr:Hypothetical protein HINF_LOCUS63331 [Hexamita inflata]